MDKSEICIPLDGPPAMWASYRHNYNRIPHGLSN